MSRMDHELSLQINLSPGDIRYAQQTVPAIVAAHRQHVRETVAIVDCCRPQSTKIIDSDKRFPLEEFQARVDRIRGIVEEFRQSGLIDRVEYLTPNSEVLNHLSRKYLRGIVRETHDYGGCALMSYLAGIELISTRYVIHYDADMLIFQREGYSWAREGVHWIKDEDSALAVVPRVCPPPTKLDDSGLNLLSFEAWPPREEIAGGWRDQWLSTRCFLLDKHRLAKFLPLVQGRTLLQILAVRFFNRGYPRSPEVMLSERMRIQGGWRWTQQTADAWLLHPLEKPQEFIDLLPEILARVKRGEVPESQRGYPDIKLDAWQSWLHREQVGA